MLLEHGAVPVPFLRGGWVDGETDGGASHFIVGNPAFRFVFQRVNPTVAYAVRELLFLAPEHFVWQKPFKGLAENVLFDAAVSAHFRFRIDPHRVVDERRVKEWHPGFNAPGHHGFVRTGAIVFAQIEHFSDRFFVKFFGVWGHVEVEVATKQFIGPLTAEHHFDAHGLDGACHEVHRRGGPNGRYVIRFDVANDLRQSVKSFLDGEGEWVVDRADLFGHFRSGGHVGTAFEADAEAVDPGPPSFGRAIIFDAVA